MMVLIVKGMGGLIKHHFFVIYLPRKWPGPEGYIIGKQDVNESQASVGFPGLPVGSYHVPCFGHPILVSGIYNRKVGCPQ